MKKVTLCPKIITFGHGIDRLALFFCDQMQTFTLLLAAIICFALLSGYRGRNPSPAVRALIADPDKRPVTVGLFMLRDMSNFVDPASDATIAYSFRYDETPFTLKTASWAIGVACIFVTSAIYLGWLFFDITTIGAWSFFVEDVEWQDRAVHAGAAVIPMFLLLAAAADERRLSNRIFMGMDWLFGFLFRGALACMVWIHASLFQNTGLIMLSLGSLALVSHERKTALIALALGYALIFFGFVGDLSVTHQAIIVFIGIVAMMTFLSFVGTVEVLCTLRWYDSEQRTIFAGLVAIALWALACAFAIPIVMVLILFIVMQLTPDSVNADWVNMVGVFREGGLPASTMLAFACIPPLLPAMWFIRLGLGTLISRYTPMMTQFMKNLRKSEGALSETALDALLLNYRRAHFFGFTAAGAITVSLLAFLTRLLSLAFEV